ncbi:MAG: LacI family transcriptional regulator [Clostridia bacterium]|nr:LacI family transcriptional regulator [Clostridia bacterium]
MNIYDIAREAGVSIATISRVINGKDVVSPKTREKVEKVLARYSYSPSEIARGLVVNSMRTIGVMTIDIRDVYYAHVAYTIERELSKQGYTVILCNTGGDTDEKAKYMKTLLQKKIDGIILVGSVFTDEKLEAYIAEISESVPVVLVNGLVEADNVYCVVCDDSEGTASAIDYLVQKGHQRIVYFQNTDTFSARKKLEGFKDGLIRNRLEFSDEIVIKVSKGLEGGIEGVDSISSIVPEYSAILCSDDECALGTVKRLCQLGIRIPEDAAVIGFNNSVFARCCSPELTSIDNKMDKMGLEAVKILTAAIYKHSNVERILLIKPELIIREST